MFLGVADESQMNINCSFSKIGLEVDIEQINSIEFITPMEEQNFLFYFKEIKLKIGSPLIEFRILHHSNEYD